jgi:hypothetical protein
VFASRRRIDKAFAAVFTGGLRLEAGGIELERADLAGISLPGFLGRKASRMAVRCLDQITETQSRPALLPDFIGDNGESLRHQPAPDFRLTPKSLPDLQKSQRHSRQI